MQNPSSNHSPELSRALEAHRRGDYKTAEPIYEQICKYESENLTALNALATLRAQQERYLEAEPIFERIYNLAPENSAIISNYGHLLYRIEHHQKAYHILKKGVQAEPYNQGLLVNLSLVQIKLERFDEALEDYNRLLSFLQSHKQAIPHKFYHERGDIYLKAGRLELAIQDYEQALNHGSADPKTLLQLAEAFNQNGNVAKAIELLDRLLAFSPLNGDYMNHKAVVLANHKLYEEASVVINRAVRHFPDNVDYRLNEANIAVECKRFQQAIAAANQFLKARPRHPDGLKILITSYRESYQFKKAHLTCHELINLQPKNADAWRAQAMIYKAEECFDLALQSVEKAVALEPEGEEHHISLALLYLLMGNFKKGWREYEWRWQKKSQQVSEFHDLKIKHPQNYWQGKEDLKGKHFILSPEQGYGDFIQFVRYAYILAKEVETVSIPLSVAHFPLIPLLEASIPKNIILKPHGSVINEFHHHATMLDVAGTLWPDDNQPPPPVRFNISASAALRAQELLGQFKPIYPTGQKIGLVVSGNPGHSNDRRRSIPVEQFKTLLSLPHDFYLLQKEAKPEDIEKMAHFKNLHKIGFHFDNFAETAAVIDAMDQVFSVDTSVLHLAATQGKSSYILLPINPDWRWRDRGECSSWYPSLTLLRQTKHGEWQDIMQRCVQILS